MSVEWQPEENCRRNDGQQNRDEVQQSGKDISHTETFVDSLIFGGPIPCQIKYIKLHLDATVNMILDCKQLRTFYNCQLIALSSSLNLQSPIISGQSSCTSGNSWGDLTYKLFSNIMDLTNLTINEGSNDVIF